MLGTPTHGDMLGIPVFSRCLLVSSADKPLQIVQIQNESYALDPICLNLMVFLGGGINNRCKYHANFPSKQWNGIKIEHLSQMQCKNIFTNKSLLKYRDKNKNISVIDELV